MSFLYRLLGITARVSERLSRTRVNDVPANYCIILVCALFVGIGSDTQLRDAVDFGKQPTQLWISQALSREGLINRYVAVTGPVLPGEALISGASSDEREALVPMVDKSSGQALLISSSQRLQGPPGMIVTVTGVLRQFASGQAAGFHSNRYRPGGLTVSDRYRLVEGDKPADPRWLGPILLLAGGPLVLLLTSAVMKNIVFQKAPAEARWPTAPLPTPEAGLNEDLRVSGKFSFGAVVARRFLSMPAALGTLKTGETVLASNIDASVKMGWRAIIDQAGLWFIIIPPNTLRVDAAGYQYTGMQRRPALRIEYLDTTSVKPKQISAILSFPTEAARNAAQDHLTNLAAGKIPAREPSPTAAADPAAGGDAASSDVPDSMTPETIVADSAAEAKPLEPAAPYRPSGRCSPAGALILLAMTLPGAVLVGWLYQLTTQRFDMVVVSPCYGGLALGLVLFMAVKKAKCRNVALAVAVALIAGLLMYGTRLVMDSQQVRPEMLQGISRMVAQDRNLPLPEAQAMVERTLGPWATLCLYLDISSRQGINITNHDSGAIYRHSESGREVLNARSGLNLQGPWYWLMLLAEAGIIGAVAALCARGRAVFPFCERCGRWFEQTRVRRFNFRQARQVVATVQRQDWNGLLEMPADGKPDQTNHTDVAISSCPHCAEGTLKILYQNGNVAKNLLNVRVPPETVQYLSDSRPKSRRL